MLIYVQNKEFVLRTFVLSVKRQDKVARVRAQLLHILYDIGKEDHQFRLRYSGEILRDADYLGDYGIGDNSIITMIPVNKKTETYYEDTSFTGSYSSKDINKSLHPPDIQDALYKEIKHLDRREKFLKDFKALLYIHSLMVLLVVLTVYWYSAAWTGILFLLAIWFVPTYTRLGGFVGNNTHWRKQYCILFGICVLACLCVTIYFSVITWMKIVNHGCKDWMFVDDCSHRQVFSALLYTIQSLLFIISCVIVWILLANFKLEVGDYIVKYLVQERDIEKVIDSAKNGRVKEKRQATFELATLAASSDDNKLMIVAEGGLEVLLGLATSTDISTQEYSLETLGELLTIPSIKETFVKIGGCSTLITALRSRSVTSMYEAAKVIYIIIEDNEEYKNVIIEGQGLVNLCYAGIHGNIQCKRMISCILLELSCSTDIREHLTDNSLTAQTLTTLCKKSDLEIKRCSLQALELMALENSEVVCSQDDLLNILLELPFKTLDENLYLLAAKILMYYAETTESCEVLLENSNLKECLRLYSRSSNPVLQKVVVKIIYCTLETRELKRRAVNLKLDQILEYLKDHPADREICELAEQGLILMKSEDDLNGLPILSTLDKLKKMEVRPTFGSSSSVGMESSCSTTSELKKEI